MVDTCRIDQASENIAIFAQRLVYVIYRNGKKILVLAGKSAPKIIREDQLTEGHTGVLLNDGICMSDE